MTDQIGLVVSGARVVNTTVPANAPRDVESTGMESVVELAIVAVNVPFTAVQFPVPPETVMIGFALGDVAALNPCPPEIVNTTGFAFVALATEIFADVG